MRPFTYSRATDEEGALARGNDPEVRYLAGGTTLIDLMRLDVMGPKGLVDIGALPLAEVEPSAGGGLRIGAMVRNSDLAYHPLVASAYPALREALLSGASPQLRNMATLGGNLMQRTRCPYFRDTAAPCNKRQPGAGCSAIGGYTRMHAVLGGSEHCIAVHPSDMCVALVALDAVVRSRMSDGTGRSTPVEGFHTLPGNTPQVETVLHPGELITHVELPASPFAARSHYLKVRDRASYAFALASVAVALDVHDGVVRDARVVLGGVATKPWRSREAEQALVGKPTTLETYRSAGAAAVNGAVGRGANDFKIELARRTVVRALVEAEASP
ncbi:MAG TPA: xanthine dehydrogenase family protein subunit M [Polyangiaceae bacterium]|jgi:xanthine dehydrogenase YagS FAD-binding subunit